MISSISKPGAGGGSLMITSMFKLRGECLNDFFNFQVWGERLNDFFNFLVWGSSATNSPILKFGVIPS